MKEALPIDDLTVWEWKEVELALEHWIDYLTTHTMNYGKDLDYKLRVKELRNKIRERGGE
jgi:hypothetical protein